MSYHGYKELLCEVGHFTAHDCWDTKPSKCHCGCAWAYYHYVNETNGYDPELDSTYPAEKREIGFDDNWQLDHYGNAYAVKVRKFSPIQDSAWVRYQGTRNGQNSLER